MNEKFPKLNRNQIMLIAILMVVLFLVDDSYLIFSGQPDPNKDISYVKISGDAPSYKNNFLAKNEEPILKISEISGPMIDSGAAVISKENVCQYESVAAERIPAKIWILLIMAYVFLIVFNLTYEFRKSVNLRWFWELLYTLFFLSLWFYYDAGQTKMWFPLYIIKLGVIIYIAYLYFFSIRKSKVNQA